MRFSKTDDAGVELCSVTVEHLYAGIFGLKRFNEAKNPITPEAWIDLFGQGIADAKRQGAKSILFRLIEDSDSAAIAKRLPELGFKKKQDRIEFQKPVDELPDDIGTPFRWVKGGSPGWTIERVAELLEAVAQGDPDGEPIEDPVAYMQDWISDPKLTAGLDCIEIGFLDDEPAALVVAQINPTTGWSRISYMGISPGFRGRGLGKWVHRKGFAMLRAQGGKLYHGGTVATNAGMLKLFARHGCPPYRKMEEWIYG